MAAPDQTVFRSFCTPKYRISGETFVLMLLLEPRFMSNCKRLVEYSFFSSIFNPKTFRLLPWLDDDDIGLTSPFLLIEGYTVLA